MANTSVRIPDKLHEDLRKCVHDLNKKADFGQKTQSLNGLIVEGVEIIVKRYSYWE